jgi:PIN domain nuclease of toxin-antitoxin system
MITTEQVAVSVISCFEIAQLVKRERLILPLPVNEWLQEALAPAGIELLPLLPAITCRAVDLTDIHKDPFDRMIIATALNYDAKLMSVDSHFKSYPELHGHLLNT